MSYSQIKPKQLTREDLVLRDDAMFPPTRAKNAVNRLRSCQSPAEIDEVAAALAHDQNVHVMNFALYASKSDCSKEALIASKKIVEHRIRMMGQSQVISCLTSDNPEMVRGVLLMLNEDDSTNLFNKSIVDCLSLFLARSLETENAPLVHEFFRKHQIGNSMTLKAVTSMLLSESHGEESYQTLKTIDSERFHRITSRYAINKYSEVDSRIVQDYLRTINEEIPLSALEVVADKSRILEQFPLPPNFKEQCDVLVRSLADPMFTPMLSKWFFINTITSGDRFNYVVESLFLQGRLSDTIIQSMLGSEDLDVVRGAVEIAIGLAKMGYLTSAKCERLLANSFKNTATLDSAALAWIVDATKPLGPSEFTSEMYWKYIGPKLLSDYGEIVHQAKWMLMDLDPHSARQLQIEPKVFMPGELPGILDEQCRVLVSQKIAVMNGLAGGIQN